MKDLLFVAAFAALLVLLINTPEPKTHSLGKPMNLTAAPDTTIKVPGVVYTKDLKSVGINPLK